MAPPTMKLAAMAALLIVLVAAKASSYRTIVTTFETIDEGSSQQQCSKQMRGKSMEACRSFLQSGRFSWALMIKAEDQGVPRECCEQMKNMDPECRCEMVKKMWQEMQEESSEGQRGQEGQSRESMKKKAQYLPAMCGMEPQVCRMSQNGAAY